MLQCEEKGASGGEAVFVQGVQAEPEPSQAAMSFAGPQEPRALEVMSPSGLGATAGLLSSPTVVGETAGPNYGSLTVGAGTDGAGAIGTGAVVVGPVQGGDLSTPAVADGQTNSGVLGSGDPGVTGGLEMDLGNDNWPVVEQPRVLESSNGGLETAVAAEGFGAVQTVQTAMEGTANAGSPTAASRTTGLEMRYVQTGTGAYGWMTRLTDFLRATTTGGGGLGDRMLGSLGLTPNQAPGTPRSHSSRAAAVAATPQSAARQSPWNFSPPEELQVMTQHVEGGGHSALFDQRAVERMNSWPSRGPLLHGEQTSQGSTGSSEIRVEVQRQLGQYMRDRRDQVQTEVVALRRQVQELMNAGFGRQSGGEAEQGVGRVPGGPQVPGDDPLHGVPHGGGSSLHGTSRAQGGLSGAGVPQVPQGPQLHGVSGGSQGPQLLGGLGGPPQLPGVSGGLQGPQLSGGSGGLQGPQLPGVSGGLQGPQLHGGSGGLQGPQLPGVTGGPRGHMVLSYLAFLKFHKVFSYLEGTSRLEVVVCRELAKFLELLKHLEVLKRMEVDRKVQGSCRGVQLVARTSRLVLGLEMWAVPRLVEGSEISRDWLECWPQVSSSSSRHS